MKMFIISKRTPPPPHRGTFDRRLTILALLFAAVSGALLLTACDSPTGENTNTNGGKVTPTTYTLTGRVTDRSTGSGVPDAEISASTAPGNVVKTRSDGSFTLQVKEHTRTFTLTVKKAGYASVTISIGAEKSNQTVPVIQLTKVYTTTVRGKVVTPARAADPAKGNNITTARVWSSVNPANKVPVDSTDGSYSLQVVNHSGSFTITAEYTAAGDKNYKTGDPRTVTTRGALIDNQDIPLNYGYTTTMSGYITTGTPSLANVAGATVTAEVEGIEAARDTTGTDGLYSVTFDHPGTVTIKVRAPGKTPHTSSPLPTTQRTSAYGHYFP